MGRETTRTETQQQQTIQASPEETELNRLRLEREKALDPSILGAQQQGLDLLTALLSGGTQGELPGFLAGLAGGISPEVTQDLVNRSLGDVRAGLQGGGLLDSGVRQELEARTSADIRTQSSQFNLQNLQQLLNLGLGNQAQTFASPLGFGHQLSQSLAGLRGFNRTESSTSFNRGNPFVTGARGLGAGAGAFFGG